MPGSMDVCKHHLSRLLCLAALTCGLFPASVWADLIKLKSGGEVRGKIATIAATPATDTVTIETPTGATVTLPAADVQFITRRPPAVEEYEVRARHAADTVDAQWDLAQWCRERRLLTERTEHLQRVIDLDPDHEPARQALGHVWKDGAWVDLDVYMAARGFVKHKGRYITQQELDLLQKTAEELRREQEWNPKIRLWSVWLTGNRADRRQEALAALQGVEDPDAAPSVIRFLAGHAVRDVRLLGVAILSRSGGEKSANGLVRITLRDDDADVRAAALTGIPAAQYTTVRPLFIKELKNDANTIVCRAAAALQQVGNEDAISPLIDALITAHAFEVRVPALPGQTYSFSTDGSFGQGMALPPDIELALRTGQMPQGVMILPTPMEQVARQIGKTVVVRREFQNAEALAALQALTGEDYGYDERSWRLWWAAKKHESGTLSKS
jgi:hypothetical protein